MGREEMADSGSIEEDVDVELDSGFCMEVDSELSLAERQELDWFVITEHGDSVLTGDEQREGIEGPRGDGRSRTQEEGEIEAGSGSVEKGETEAESGVEMDDQTEEEETEGALDVCLGPVEESGGHVRISLEEVERYYRFSRCCRWLCGRCWMFYHVLSSFLCIHHKSIILLSQSFLNLAVFTVFIVVESYPCILY